MACTEAYKEHIVYSFNAFCKVVIRYAAINAWRDRAGETGPKTFEAIRRMFDEAEAEEQPMQTAGAILSTAGIHPLRILEKACGKALGQCHMLYYKTIYSNAKSKNSGKELTEFILILDEWLDYKLTEKDAKNLYELFEQRSGSNPAIFAGQYPVDECHNRLGGGTQADHHGQDYP